MLCICSVYIIIIIYFFCYLWKQFQKWNHDNVHKKNPIEFSSLFLVSLNFCFVMFFFEDSICINVFYITENEFPFIVFYLHFYSFNNINKIFVDDNKDIFNNLWYNWFEQRMVQRSCNWSLLCKTQFIILFNKCYWVHLYLNFYIQFRESNEMKWNEIIL